MECEFNLEHGYLLNRPDAFFVNNWAEYEHVCVEIHGCVPNRIATLLTDEQIASTSLEAIDVDDAISSNSVFWIRYHQSSLNMEHTMYVIRHDKTELIAYLPDAYNTNHLIAAIQNDNINIARMIVGKVFVSPSCIRRVKSSDMYDLLLQYVNCVG